MNFLPIGTSVSVDDPKKNDLWNHSFIGTVIDLINNKEESYYIVEDQEGNTYCPDLDQVHSIS